MKISEWLMLYIMIIFAVIAIVVLIKDIQKENMYETVCNEMGMVHFNPNVSKPHVYVYDERLELLEHIGMCYYR